MSERTSEWNGGVYVVRDVWSDGGHEYRMGLKLDRCEYAVMDGDQKVWKPCIEGVMWADIEPLRRTDG
jgi:hypothetical protein